MDRSAFQRACRQACNEVGLPGATIHDLRSSWVRDAEKAGIARSVAISITRHVSEEVYRRYAIVSPADQQKALARIGDAQGRIGAGRTVLKFSREG